MRTVDSEITKLSSKVRPHHPFPTLVDAVEDDVFLGGLGAGESQEGREEVHVGDERARRAGGDEAWIDKRRG